MKLFRLFYHFATLLNKISRTLEMNSILNGLFDYFNFDGRPALKKKEKKIIELRLFLLSIIIFISVFS